MTSYSVYILQKSAENVLPTTLFASSRDNIQGSREAFSIVRQVLAPPPKRYAIQGLKCGTHYSVYVVAQNQVGMGDKSNLVNVKTVGAGELV